jgi:hypothetical protein
MAPTPPYSVPDQSAVRVAAKLAAQYRAQVDQDTLRRREGGVIDVTPQRVSIESDASSANRPQRPPNEPEAQAPPSRDTNTEPASARTHRKARLDEEIRTADDEGFIYEPNADDIDMRPSPKERGLFIDYMA